MPSADVKNCSRPSFFTSSRNDDNNHNHSFACGGGSTKNLTCSGKGKHSFNCNTCGIKCTSEYSFKQHMSGAKHRANLQNEKGVQWNIGESATMKASPFAPNKGVFSFIGSNSNNGGNTNGFNVSSMFAPDANSSFTPSKGVFAVDHQPTYSSSAALSKTGTDDDNFCVFV